MIQKDLIFASMNAETKEEIISLLADKLLGMGKVKDTYKDAVLEREKSYPTGLSLGKYCIAMPHTFAEHVIEPAIAVAKLEKPVTFLEMASTDSRLSVSLILMMAISNPQEQLVLLRKILRLFSEKEVIDTLMQSKTAEEMYKTLRYIDEP
ncbi:PTS sugar transporter subunit IIA [Candidatus Merdisoma sp. JLR.KK006]|uniref:PTS sugar transporter subunit IIA n=1 Tax=Candidatus Merdisoma sp. JLR.KK006 TaxID=3112626 RepID=UPI002FF330F3